MILIDRLAFVCIPILFYGLPGLQLMALIKLKFFMLAFQLKYAPWDIDRTSKILKMVAEYIQYLIVVLFIVLSDFQHDL